MSSKLEIEIKNDIAAIGRAAELIGIFISENSLPGELINAVNLSVEELLTNTIFYGYDDKEEHIIKISMSIENNELVIKLTDDAREYDPLKKDDPDINIPLEERKIGGLGIFLVKQMMNSFEYKRDGKNNIITLKKKF